MKKKDISKLMGLILLLFSIGNIVIIMFGKYRLSAVIVSLLLSTVFAVITLYRFNRIKMDISECCKVYGRVLDSEKTYIRIKGGGYYIYHVILETDGENKKLSASDKAYVLMSKGFNYHVTVKNNEIMDFELVD